MNRNIFCSVSFGLSSVATLIHLHTHPKYRECNILAAFSNTSDEHEETYIFGEKITKDFGVVWIEGVYPMEKGKGIGYRIVTPKTAKKKCEVFEAMIKKANIPTKTGGKVGLPNHATPYCSDRLKKTPLHKLAKDYFNGESYVTALGFRREDVEISRRITYAEIKESKDYIYPLITDFGVPLSQKEVLQVVKSAGYYLGIPSSHGNCKSCYKRSEKKQIEMIRNGMLTPDWVKKMELKYNDRFYRGYQSIDDLVKKAKMPYTIDMFSDEGESCLCGI